MMKKVVFFPFVWSIYRAKSASGSFISFAFGSGSFLYKFRPKKEREREEGQTTIEVHHFLESTFSCQICICNQSNCDANMKRISFIHCSHLLPLFSPSFPLSLSLLVLFQLCRFDSINFLFTVEKALNFPIPSVHLFAKAKTVSLSLSLYSHREAYVSYRLSHFRFACLNTFCLLFNVSVTFLTRPCDSCQREPIAQITLICSTYLCDYVLI
jgi:hypothetical protein